MDRVAVCCRGVSLQNAQQVLQAVRTLGWRRALEPLSWWANRRTAADASVSPVWNPAAAVFSLSILACKPSR